MLDHYKEEKQDEEVLELEEPNGSEQRERVLELNGRGQLV